jgi:chemotaxis methyl-accepting protein methylase
MAYVVVQHLNPDHVSTLAELLQRGTPMPVVEATDRLQVRPDCVYVIPPNKDLSLMHGQLHLLDPTVRRGLRLAVDFFLRTLAEDCQEKAVGVILSGMGSDGMLGLRTIKEYAGLTVAQEPTTAGASSMPQSAINTGMVDIVAPAEQLPARILDFLRHSSLPEPVTAPVVADNGSGLEKILILLRDRCGADLSLYKTSTLYRRIERRIALHQIAGIDDYVLYLRDNPQELDLLFKEVLIGVTHFFRDTAVWERLRNEILPAMFARHPAGKALRAWVPACSSGEEAFSLAIVFREALEQVQPPGRFTLQIYATDLDPDAIARARKGSYPKNIAADVTPERLASNFVAADDGYRVGKAIRDMVVFAPQNIISDPPFTRLDLLSCRNLLIYFHADLQKKLMPVFHYALNPEGILVLGSAETVGGFGKLFAATDSKGRIFHRLPQNLPLSGVPFAPRLPVDFISTVDLLPPERGDSLAQLTDQLIQQTYAPAAVLVNADGDILYISGRTGKYLEPAAGKVNINIHAMAREGLREALIGVIPRALRQSETVHLTGVKVGTNGGTQIVNVIAQGMDNPAPLRGRVLIVFEDVATPPTGRRSRKPSAVATQDAVMQELAQTRESLRVTHEEMQSSLEEIKSANEELQSTNEELQSTNEELTTSKEEMQSLNEELQTVNAELQSKVDDLTWERNDMNNLLNSTEIATVFLDNAMKVRRFTGHATHLFKLIPGDVGRLLSDVVNDLDYPQLLTDAQEVLQTLVFRELQVSTHDGRWYRVRIMPYRTQDNVIDGVVATFIDITEIKQLEAGLRQQSEPKT